MKAIKVWNENNQYDIMFFSIAIAIVFSMGAIGHDYLKGKLLYANSLAKQSDVNDWIIEGLGKIHFDKDGFCICFHLTNQVIMCFGFQRIFQRIL